MNVGVMVGSVCILWKTVPGGVAVGVFVALGAGVAVDVEGFVVGEMEGITGEVVKVGEAICKGYALVLVGLAIYIA